MIERVVSFQHPLAGHQQMAKEEIVSVTPNRVKPALFKFQGSSWHWVWLPELAEVIGWGPDEIISVFRDLAKVAYQGRGAWGIGELHWREANGETCCQLQPHCEPPHGSIYVPAGFSEDVIQVREWGVVRIQRVIHGMGFPLMGSLRDFYVKPDPMDPRKNRMALVGLTHPTIDTLRVWAPLGKQFPLLG